jgi:hypothetical protein
MEIINKINKENNKKPFKLQQSRSLKPQKLTLKSCQKELCFKVYEDS